MSENKIIIVSKEDIKNINKGDLKNLSKEEFTNMIYKLICSKYKPVFEAINKNSLEYIIKPLSVKNSIISYAVNNKDKSFDTEGIIFGFVINKKFFWNKHILDDMKKMFSGFLDAIKMNEVAKKILLDLFKVNVDLNDDMIELPAYLISIMFTHVDDNVLRFETDNDDGTITYSYSLIQKIPVELTKDETNLPYILFAIVNDFSSITNEDSSTHKLSRSNNNDNKKISKTIFKKSSKKLSRKIPNIKYIKT